MIRRSFRFTCPREQIPLVGEMLKLQGFAYEPDPFFLPAARLEREPFPLGNSLAASFGLIYIQDRASMLPPLALCPPKGASVLDLCASPGSKTSQLAWLVGPDGMILGNEPSPSRLANLRRNLLALCLPQTVTCCQDGSKIPLPDALWDWIQLDPPCSGWGTVEKNPKVKEIWKEDRLPPLLRLQRALLKEAVRLLRPGGVLAYSTCTTNPQENEEQVAFACGELGLVQEALPPLPGFDFQPVKSFDGVWNLQPSQDSQGFFVARLRKPGKPSGPVPYTDAPVHCPALEEKELAALGINPRSFPYSVGIFDSAVHALPIQALALLPASLHWQGLYMGKRGKGGEIRFSPRIRLEGDLPRLSLEGAEGIRSMEGLFQGQSLPAPQCTGKEVMLCWNGLPLMRLAVKGNRVVRAER